MDSKNITNTGEWNNLEKRKYGQQQTLMVSNHPDVEYFKYCRAEFWDLL